MSRLRAARRDRRRVAVPGDRRSGGTGGGDCHHRPAILRGPQVFPNPRLCQALVDRLTDRAHIIATGSDCSGSAGPSPAPAASLEPPTAGRALLHSPYGLRSGRPTQRKARADPKGGQHSLAQGSQVSLTRPSGLISSTRASVCMARRWVEQGKGQPWARIPRPGTATPGDCKKLIGVGVFLAFLLVPLLLLGLRALGLWGGGGRLGPWGSREPTTRGTIQVMLRVPRSGLDGMGRPARREHHRRRKQRRSAPNAAAE